jgi:hypothetical protein
MKVSFPTRGQVLSKIVDYARLFRSWHQHHRSSGRHHHRSTRAATRHALAFCRLRKDMAAATATARAKF